VIGSERWEPQQRKPQAVRVCIAVTAEKGVIDGIAAATCIQNATKQTRQKLYFFASKEMSLYTELNTGRHCGLPVFGGK
jgi:hypothetical protein